MVSHASRVPGAVHLDHSVQFYVDPEFLARSVAGFLAEGLAAGEAAMVVATRANRAAIADYLANREHDPEALEREGRYVALDAAQLLSGFTFSGRQDVEAFRAQVGGMVDDTLRRSGASQLRVYGEMVDLLWRDGMQQATIELERSWNAFARTRPIALMCSYQLEGFCRPGRQDPFEGVCAQHSRVLPAESYAEGDEDARLRTIARLQRGAGTLEWQGTQARQAEAALRRTRARLQEAQLLLQQAMRMRDELLDLAGQEVIAPLNLLHLQLRGILQVSDQARQPLEADWLRYRIGHAGEDLGRIAEMLEGVVDVVRLRTGTDALDRQPGCLAALLEAFAEEFRRQTHGCRVRVDLQESPGCWDARRMSRLLQALFGIAAGDSDTAAIRVAMEARASSVTVVVEPDPATAGHWRPRHRPGARLEWWMAEQLAGLMGGSLAMPEGANANACYLTLPRAE